MAGSHSFNTPSMLTEAKFPLGEKATASVAVVWPRKVWSSFPATVSHTFTVLSWFPAASHRLLGEKASEVTPNAWPASRCRMRPD